MASPRSAKTAPAKKAAVADMPLRLEYLDVAQLNEHPDNWRLHPPGQLDAIDTLIGEVGWAGALLYNERTKRLLDGHARRQLALRRGGTVPVLIGSWDEAQERKILALMDSVGDMAETDTDKLRDLLGDTKDLAESLRPAVQDKLVNFTRATVPVMTLKEHPRNYKQHPAEQIEQLAASIEQHGFFRPIVVARDHTILAGHGVKLAAVKAGKLWVPVIKMPLDPDDPRALKILAADNEIGRLAMRDDRAMTDMLREICGDNDDLLGTGYDKQSLSALVFTTRAGQINREEDAAEWVGMPDFDPGAQMKILRMMCRSPEDMEDLIKRLKDALPGITVSKRQTQWNAWWPPTERHDLDSVRWDSTSEA